MLSPWHNFELPVDIEDLQDDLESEDCPVHDAEVAGSVLQKLEQASFNSSSMVIFPLPFAFSIAGPVEERSVFESPEFGNGLFCGIELPPLNKPIKPTGIFEWDNEVGGVLMILLEPAIVDSIVDDIDEEDDDDEKGLEAFSGVECFFGGYRESGCAGSDCGADEERPLLNCDALELRLFAVPLAAIAPELANLDRCI